MSASDKNPAARRDAAPTPAVTPQQQSLLLSPVSSRPRAAAPLAAARAAPLWLSLYLPQLPLEALAAEQALYAVFEERHGQRQVLQASPAAMQAGVQPGLSVNAALALLPGLQLEQRDTALELRVLQTLAAWAERYTSFVVMEAPSLLLLEINASLRLYRGLKRLRRQIVTELAAEGYSAWPAIAPTPLAATWLARAATRRCVLDNRRLAGELARVPLACLDWPARVTAALQGMGLRNAGELLRLPRDGFAKRFGSGRLLQLDRAIGRLPDPRDHYRATPRFSAHCDLPEEQDNLEILLAACDNLLQKLERFLRTRQQATQRLYFRFHHLQQAATELTLGSLQNGRSALHWLALLRIRLEQLELPAAVIGISLCSGESQPLTASTGDFGFAAGGERGSITPLVERLAARIGERAIHGIGTLAEHRPDRAWCRLPAVTTHCAAPKPPLPYRPLWMLEQPEQLRCRDGRPWYRGRLTLASGPERIETGWWDEAGVSRDYYVAQNPQGICLWVFRDRRRTADWYLHGIFS